MGGLAVCLRRCRPVSRKLVGWAVADHMRADLATEAFDMAIGRRPVAPGLVFHSDRGSQYASKAMGRRLRRHKMRQSMSRRGDCCDNAVVESFNDKLKQELVHRRVWPTKSEVTVAIAEYIGRFCNAKRMRSTLGVYGSKCIRGVTRRPGGGLANSVSGLADHGHLLW